MSIGFDIQLNVDELIAGIDRPIDVPLKDKYSTTGMLLLLLY